MIRPPPSVAARGETDHRIPRTGIQSDTSATTRHREFAPHHVLADFVVARAEEGTGTLVHYEQTVRCRTISSLILRSRVPKKEVIGNSNGAALDEAVAQGLTLVHISSST